MAEDRKPYRREAEDKRRQALIAATLSLVSDGGIRATTVRAIAERAGVTPGLIRHYFQSKENLVLEAFRHLMTALTADCIAVLAYSPRDPYVRLAAFVAATMRPPVVDKDVVVRWAAFLHETQRNRDVHAIHHQSYLVYRGHLHALIAALPGNRSAAECRQLAIAANALLDGLWIEGATLTGEFADNELVEIAIRSVGALLGVDLARYLLLSEPPKL